MRDQPREYSNCNSLWTLPVPQCSPCTRKGRILLVRPQLPQLWSAVVSRYLRSDQCLHWGISKKTWASDANRRYRGIGDQIIKNFHLLQLPCLNLPAAKVSFFGTCLICFASFVYSNLLLSLSSIHLSDFSVYLSIHSWIHPFIHVVLRLSFHCLFTFSHSIQNSDMLALTVSSLMQLHRIHYISDIKSPYLLSAALKKLSAHWRHGQFSGILPLLDHPTAQEVKHQPKSFDGWLIIKVWRTKTKALLGYDAHQLSQFGHNDQFGSHLAEDAVDPRITGWRWRLGAVTGDIRACNSAKNQHIISHNYVTMNLHCIIHVVYCEHDLRPSAKPCLCDAGVSGTTRSTEVSISAEASTHPGAAVKETAESLRHPYAMWGMQAVAEIEPLFNP